MNTDWYFTAPWEAAPVRRGDPLGFRAGADYFSDIITPGLSNGTSDARWITLLSWCLKWSHFAWTKAGGGDLSNRDDQRARYAWLRPLELLWVDRTLESEQTTGQLRGINSVKRWRESKRHDINFSMTDEQFRRYRQVGTYGAYRVVFRTIKCLTAGGDGWTPTGPTLELARLVDESLPDAVRLNEGNFENGTKWGSWRGQEACFWIQRGWRGWRTNPNQGLLPTPEERIREQFPVQDEQERKLLASALFGQGSIRGVTAKALAEAKKIKTHAELCEALANSTRFDEETRAKLAPLPTFSRLADASMGAMRMLWHAINHNGEVQAPTIKRVMRSGDMEDNFNQLKEASSAWLDASNTSNFPHLQAASSLATAIQQANSLEGQIRALAKHHTDYGGGRRWFNEQTGTLVPLVPDKGISASDYRFRLRSICLLAAQCGIADMNHALDILDADSFGEKQASDEQKKDEQEATNESA